MYRLSGFLSTNPWIFFKITCIENKIDSPKSNEESKVSVSVVVVMLVKWVEADSVEVFIVASEFVEELITMTFGTEDPLLVVMGSLPVLADLK